MPEEQAASPYLCAATGCGQPIPPDRVRSAQLRGQRPRYCSDECRTRQGNRDAYARRQGLAHGSPGLRSVTAQSLYDAIVARARADGWLETEAAGEDDVLRVAEMNVPPDSTGTLVLVESNRSLRVFWEIQRPMGPTMELEPIPELHEVDLSELTEAEALRTIFG